MVGKSEGVVAEVGKKNALSYVLKAVCDYWEVEQILIFERNDRDEFWLAYEVPMFWLGVPKVGIV